LKADHFDDPVAAYDRLAAEYPDLCRKRELYLRSVEREIVSRIPPGSRSLLDLGAGDGSRSIRIAAQVGIERVVVVEPSARMTGKSAEQAEVWPIRAEDLAQESVSPCGGGHPGRTAEKFDVIICLWNVLGHVSAEKRIAVLSSVASLLSRAGIFFLDVNHRYNFRSYGFLATSVRWLHDLFVQRESNGDVRAKWNLNGATISTRGHVFIHDEIMRLARAAGLELAGRVVIDYGNGSVRRFAFQGNLLYIFRRNSWIDSPSAPQTSRI